jgi:hypothetical protein
MAKADPVPVPRPKPLKTKLEALLDPRPFPEKKTEVIQDSLQAERGNWPKTAGRWPAKDVARARRQCEQSLKALNLIWRPDMPIGQPGGCGTPVPIAVSEIAGVRINPPATINCEFAVALHSWVRGSLQPAARKSLGTKVLEIKNASSYACRRRNNGRRGKLSEHAFANALDMSGFVFAQKARVSVVGDWSGLFQTIGLSGRGNFLRRIRKESCQYFNTVLGPGSDAHHEDHLHVDLMRLRPGRYKMCR